MDIDRYLDNPSILIDLCRKVIDGIDENNNICKTASMDVQLKELSKTIEKLEKAGVGVPDALRAEKLRVSSLLDNVSEARKLLCDFAEGLDSVLKELYIRLGNNNNSISNGVRGRRTKTTEEHVEQIKQLRALKHTWASIDNEVFGLTNSHGARSWTIAKKLGFS